MLARRSWKQGATAWVTAVAALAGGMDRARAATVPFTETFGSGVSGWVHGTSSIPAWSASGGAGDEGFISFGRTMSAGQFNGSGFGAILFRGNAANDASGDAFAGNWLADGVTEFSAFVRHDAPAALNFFLRLDAGGGAAASSIVQSVPSNTWTRLTVPIVDSAASFQSYGAGTFTSVFSHVQNVQIALAPTQPAAVLNGMTTYTLGLDNVAVVPEPSAAMLGASAVACVVVLGWRRRRALAMPFRHPERSRA